VLSTVIAATTQGIETYNHHLNDEKDRRRSREEYIRTERTLFEIRRGLYPIKDVQIYASANINMRHHKLKSYLQRLRKHRGTLAAKEGGWDSTTHITLPSFLRPDRKNEPLAWRLLMDFGVEIDIYKQPINFGEHGRPIKIGGSDLEIKSRPINADLQLEIEEDELIVRVTNWNLRADPRDIRLKSGKIATVLDLYGSQAFVTFRYDDWDDADDAIYEIMQESKLNYVRLQVGSANIWLEPLREHRDEFRRVYVCTLSDKTKFSGIDLTLLLDEHRGAQK
jgi:hypothetical protein